MNGALVFRWSGSVPGREARGLDVFGKAIARFEQLAKDGRIESHREYFAISGGDGGFMLAEGEVSELATIMADEDTRRLNVQAAAIVEGFESQLFGGGSDGAVQELLGQYTGGLQELGYL